MKEIKMIKLKETSHAIQDIKSGLYLMYLLIVVNRYNLQVPISHRTMIYTYVLI